MSPRVMPPIGKIIAYWREHQDEADLRSQWIGWGEPFCFACGWLPPVAWGRHDSWQNAGKWMDRAHLMDRCAGGPDEPSNLVMLCHLCHDRMPPFTDRASALAWVRATKDRDPCWQMWTDALLWNKHDVHRSVTLTRARLRFMERMASVDAYVAERGEDALAEIEARAGFQSVMDDYRQWELAV